MQRAVALHPKPNNVLDHLGVLAAILEIPLIVSEEKTLDLARLFYPQVNTLLMEERELTLDYLASNFDILFVSSKLWAVELYHLFPLLHQKKMRIVYCPHGNSDKGHTLTKEDHNAEDVSLVYGEHMKDLLKDTGALDKIGTVIATGNYRYSFFLEHQKFYEQLTDQTVFSKLGKNKKTIFYAPTWHSEESPSSFYTECSRLIDQIPSSFNLLIKLHPYLYEQNPVKTTLICENYKDHPQVLFLEDFPPIYPLLMQSDAYLGDFSSIGYDFLKMDRPMYFFNPADSDLTTDRGRFLHHCGMQIPANVQENPFTFIQRTLEDNQRQFTSIRQKTYVYAFGPDNRLAKIRQDILSKIQ